MSDLISRSEMIRAIEEHYINLTNNNVPRSIPDFYSEMQKLVYNQPTAFDTEKVVEQIHDKYCHKCRNILGKQSSEEYCKSVKCKIDALCDIVKKGGVE